MKKTTEEQTEGEPTGRYGQVDPEIVESWLSSLELSDSTLRNYEVGFRTFAKFVEDRSYNFDELEEQHIREFRDYLLRESGLEISTTLNYFNGIRSFYRSAETSCFQDITRNVSKPKFTYVPKKSALSISQARKLIASFGEKPASEGNARDKAIISLMLHTGMHCVEILSANVGDLGTSNDRSILSVRVKGIEDVNMPVEIAAPLDADIRHYLRLRGRITSTSPLFASVAPRNRGGRLTERSVTRIVKGALKRIGIDEPQCTAHSLCHVPATFARFAGDDPEALSAALYGIGPVLPAPDDWDEIEIW